MDSSSHEKMESFLLRINIEIYDRIMSGNFDANAEKAQLLRFLETARQINSAQTTMGIYTTLYWLQLSTGQFAASIETMATAAAEFASVESPLLQQRRLNFIVNEAETLYIMGRVEDALALQQQVMEQLDAMAASIGHRAREYNLVCTDTARSLAALRRLDEAHVLYSQALQVQEAMNLFQVLAIVDAYSGLTEYHIEHGDLSTAWDSASIGLEIAQREKDVRRTYGCACACAHVARAKGDDPQPHYDAAHTALAPALKSAYNISAILEEARFHRRHNDPVQAAHFAAQAQTAFHAIDVHVFDTELAQLGAL